ncbi:MAG: bacillithiol biosynthesis deacetylase BshB1 [Chlamydiales bacterium]
MVDVLVFGSHPDDVEFGCGGVLAKLASQGKTIVIVDLTLGEKGSNGTPTQRRDEAHAAAHLVNATRMNFEIEDCNVSDTYENRLLMVRIIREYQPRLVLAPMSKGEQNHPDHVACGAMARAACRYARFPNILPELPVHRPEGILHYMQRNFDVPTVLIDISEHVELWKKMIRCHASQLATFPYDDWVLEKASYWGKLIGVEYAQGFYACNPIVVEDIMTISKGTQEI